MKVISNSMLKPKKSVKEFHMEDQSFKSTRQYGDIAEEIDKLETMCWKFSNFAIFPNPLLIISSSTISSTQMKTLEANLPDSIYIRAYKSRQDLMKAVIVGPKGTSYSHVLFFFDTQFPSNYPAQPPELFYLSWP